MNRLEQICELNEMLLKEMPQMEREAKYFPKDTIHQRRLLRSLMNVRMPRQLDEEYIRLQDALLSEEREEKGVVLGSQLPGTKTDLRIAIWKGDITRLKVDAIVNAANSQLLGCFVPCHGCIDNAIHSAAGLQLREECNQLMQMQGHEETTGRAKITGGYNLPAKYVIHTVGPIVYGDLTEQNKKELASCYRSCLEIAEENKLHSIAFCCISTGVFHFPADEAAKIAVDTVKTYLKKNTSLEKVIFNVFKEDDKIFYEHLLNV